MIEYSVLELFSPFLLGYCDCGCNQPLRTLKNHNKIITYFVQGHGIRVKDRTGFNHPNYINGRIKDNGGYWRILVPGYRGCDDHGRVREHIYNFEQYHKCCMLSWGHVHHIDGNKENNMPWNLQGVMKSRHTQIHSLGKNRVDFSDRCCFSCKSNKTEIRKERNLGGVVSPHWKHLPWDKINWYCVKCYKRLKRRRKD